jgi:glyoxylase-like metal-dependent hydrolase (beta-lactamase superfamily II)
LSGVLRIEGVTVGALRENCYLLADVGAGVGVLVDPGAEGERLVALVRDAGVELQAIWLTHGHFDHLGAIAEARRHWPRAPIHLHPADRPLYELSGQSAAAFGVPFEEPPPADAPLADGDKLSVGAYEFTVMHCPGHSPGHVVFHGPDVALVGDCLFAGSVGRTDLPLSSSAELAASLERIAALPAQTRVLAGHGPETTIRTERETNPFLNGVARLLRR